MNPTLPTAGHVLARLRQFARPRPAADHCELCGVALPLDHAHLVEPASRQLVCSCGPCAVLFSGREGARFRRVPREVQSLPDLWLPDNRWHDLRLPINLAFFLDSSPAGRVLALYPSPAGATESPLELDAWHALVADNPVLAKLEPDVEALLVNRTNADRAYFRAPIDECFKLVGLIRTHWRGLSGGTEVWQEVTRFFAALNQRSLGGGG